MVANIDVLNSLLDDSRANNGQSSLVVTFYEWYLS